MIAKNMWKMLSTVLSLFLVSASSQILSASRLRPPAPQSASKLQSLVAPIALYPDSLVAQILTASTFPDQVAVADYWVQQKESLTGSALIEAVDKQTWDASVKALTEFPSVL